MLGIVKAISEKNKSVLIESEGRDEWFTLGEKVKIAYVNKGECEFKTSEASPMIITFIKGTGAQRSPNTPQQPSQPTPPPTWNKPQESTGNEIKRMSALKASSRIFQGTADVDSFQKLTDAVVSYIEQGLWIEKV